MNTLEAIEQRHSVRKYTDKKIPKGLVDILNAELADCNGRSGLHIQLVTEEPMAFGGMMAHYGSFSGVKNYFALVGPKSERLDELCGYYGERLVLRAQCLGLNTCWVALTFSKSAARKKLEINAGEKLALVIALGYGETQGVPHRSKPTEQLFDGGADAPDWFRAGARAALLAPTAVNQQKFKFTRYGDSVEARSLGGFYSEIDLGIAKYHFEVGAGADNFTWK